MISSHAYRYVKGYAMVLAATLIWSGNFIVARILHDSISPVTIVVLRSAIAIFVLAPFVTRSLYFEAHLIRKHVTYLGVTAFLGMTMCNTLVYVAAASSKAVNLTLIAICSPIFTIIFARIFLKDSLTVNRIASLMIASSGVVYLVTNGNLSSLGNLSFNPGDIWMLGQASSFALYSILVQKRPLELSPLPFLFSLFVLGMLFLLPWFGWELLTTDMIELSPSTFWAIIYLGVGPSVLAYMSWNKSVALIGPSRASFVYYCLPLFSGIEALFLLDEHITTSHVISGALILTGVILSTRD